MMQDLFSSDFQEEDKKLKCPVITKGRVKLTSAQSEFNRLNKKIRALKMELTQLPAKIHLVDVFYQERIVPLQEEYNILFMKGLLNLDAKYEKCALSDEDRQDLSGSIQEMCFALISDMRGLNEEEQKAIRALCKKHELLTSGLTPAEHEKQTIREMLGMFEYMTGFEATKEMENAGTEEELSGLIEDFLLNQNPEEAAGTDNGVWEDPDSMPESEPWNKRKMTKTELKRKMQEEQTKKSIRTIYMELAKTLHPDLEQDESLRAIKEERMKQLTEAYQKNDLAALLVMQISWLEESVNMDLVNQSDTLLKGYNKILREQLCLLEEEWTRSAYSIPLWPEELCRMLKQPQEKLNVCLESFFLDKRDTTAAFLKKSKSWGNKAGMKKLIQGYREKSMVRDILVDFMYGLVSEDQ